VRIENPELKVGYIPKIKIAHGIYLGDTIIKNTSGKAYLNVIRTLDEETEVQVPTLRLKPLNEVFDDYKSKLEDLNDLEEPIHTEEEIKHEAINKMLNELIITTKVR